LWAIPVEPVTSYSPQFPFVANTYEITPLCMTVLPYQYWNGTMVYELEVIASVFHRATVVVLYDPSGATWGVGDSFQDSISGLQHWTLHLNGHTRHKLEIPWKQMAPMKEVRAPIDTGVVSDGLTVYSNGILKFGLLNPVTTNGSSDPIVINVYQSGKDMRLGGVRPDFTYAYTTLTSTIPSNTNDKFYEQFFGEECAHTVKELSSRMGVSMRYDIGDSVAIAPRSGLFFFIRNQMEFIGSTVKGAFYSNLVTGYNFVDYFSGSYVGVRGSYNYSVFANGGLSTPFEAAAAQLVAKTSQTGNATLDVGSGVWVAGPSGQTFVVSRINPSLDWNAPYYFNGLFCPTFQTKRVSNTLATFPGTKVKLSVDPSTAPANITPPAASGLFKSSVILKSSGDDFCFVGFRGTPFGIHT